MHKPNVTVAAVVHCNDRYLMVEERDKTTGKVVINQPAGHLEADETLADAASRELFEETGLCLSPSSLIGIYNLHAPNGIHYMRFCFHFSCDPMQPPSPQDPDIIAAHWMTLDEISSAPVRSELVIRCINDSLTRPHVPLELIYDPKNNNS